jgi:toxic protein SymE
MAQEKVKQVKLQGKYRPQVNHWQGGREVPWLTVSGVWLQQAGFNVGDAVEITVEQNTLIIKNCSANGNQAH